MSFAKPEKLSGFKQNLGRNSYKRGKKSEFLAALWLICRGYRIVARRWRCAGGEIDIIAKRGRIIAIVEIKARPNLRQAMEAMSAAQMRRIEAAADYWRATRLDYAQLRLRFDLIAICPYHLPKHIKAFWTA